jgi:isopenicillin N synthase-like dioxygenase
VPRPGTFAVNVFKLLELASIGYLKAMVHRVVNLPPRDATTPLMPLFKPHG